MPNLSQYFSQSPSQSRAEVASVEPEPVPWSPVAESGGQDGMVSGLNPEGLGLNPEGDKTPSLWSLKTGGGSKYKQIAPLGMKSSQSILWP